MNNLGTILMLALTVSASAQSDGTYQIEKSVIASGGGSSSGGSYSMDATSGQAIAGGPATGTGRQLYSGFWSPPPLATTAAPVTISGRIFDPYGRGLRSAAVTLTDMQGTVRTVYSNSFGYYRFSDVNAGESYVLAVSARRYSFSEPTRFVSIQDTMAGLDFRAAALRPAR